METIVKFIDRTVPTGGRAGLPVASSTLGKKGLIDIDWRPVTGEEMPQPGQLWRVHILRETNVGRNRGSFILQPMRKIDIGNMRKLQTGFADIEVLNSTVICHPKHGLGDLAPQEVDYMLALPYKRALMQHYKASAVVVCLGGEYWAARP